MEINPKINKKEVLHYLRYNSNNRNENIDKIIDEMINKVEKLNYKYRYEFYDIKNYGNFIDISGIEKLYSKDLSYHLRDSSKIALVGVSLSLEFERTLLMYQKIDSLRALIFDACGSAFVEAVCDELSDYFERDIKLFSTTRFSPGYGDLDLNTQVIFYQLLQMNKMGVELSESFLMIPRKTVTAVVGFTKHRYNFNKVICDCEECSIPCKKLKVENND